MIGGGQKTKIHPRSVDVMPLTEDKFEVREKFYLIFLSKDRFISFSVKNPGIFRKFAIP